MEMVVAYVATCATSGKRYVGITRQTLGRRRSRHIQEAKRGTVTPLYAAMRKYGKDGFVFEHIATARTWEDACEVERFLIRDLQSIAPNGFNLSEGGQGEPAKFLTAERKAKMAADRKAYWDARGRKHTPKNERIARGTPEFRALIAETTKAAMQRSDIRQRMMAGIAAQKVADPHWKDHMIGRVPSEATREKMRMAKLGHKQSAELVAKRVAKLRGQVRSPEIRAKFSQIQQRRTAAKVEEFHGRA